MIYITGDTHCDFRRFAKRQHEELSFDLTEKDSVIICGDFGLLWAKDGTFEYNGCQVCPFRFSGYRAIMKIMI